MAYLGHLHGLDTNNQIILFEWYNTMDLRPKMPRQPVWHFIFEVDTESTSYIDRVFRPGWLCF